MSKRPAAATMNGWPPVKRASVVVGLTLTAENLNPPKPKKMLKASEHGRPDPAYLEVIRETMGRSFKVKADGVLNIICSFVHHHHAPGVWSIPRDSLAGRFSGMTAGNLSVYREGAQGMQSGCGSGTGDFSIGQKAYSFKFETQFNLYVMESLVLANHQRKMRIDDDDWLLD